MKVNKDYHYYCIMFVISRIFCIILAFFVLLLVALVKTSSFTVVPLVSASLAVSGKV